MKIMILWVILVLCINFSSASLLLHDSLDDGAEGMKDTGTFISAGNS